jgi:RNA polymerase sigma-70 factor (ECF subfamily)
MTHPPDDGDADRPSASTRDLLLDAKAGRSSAVARLWHRHLPRLTQWARGRLPRWARERADTDDLVQDTVVKAGRQLAHFEPQGKGALDGYLRRALMNRVRDEMRWAQRRPRVDDGEAVAAREDPGPSAQDQAIGEETFSRYQAALARLKDDDRQVVIARVEMSLSHAEIAQALGKPSEDAARMALTRALQRLAKEMQEDG